MTLHIITHPPRVLLTDRMALKGHAPALVWFTGLSGSGKSTIAAEVEHRLNHDYQAHTYFLDGDGLRVGLNKDLTFSPEDRAENIRRAGEVSRLLFDAGLIVLTALISPFRAERDRVRAMFSAGAFIEVFVQCPLEVCEARDAKGLYRRARAGEIADFTGISSPYEPPQAPELTLASDQVSVEDCTRIVIQLLHDTHILRPNRPLSPSAGH